MSATEMKILTKKGMKSSDSSVASEAGTSDPRISNTKIYLSAFTCALTAFHFGYAITSINAPSKIFLECRAESITHSILGLKSCFPVSKQAWGLVGTGLPLGGWIGGTFAPKIVSRMGGLRPAILALNIPLFLAYAFLSMAQNLPMLIIGRCFVGFVAGSSGMMVPLYLSSISPFALRGTITNFFQLFLCTGTFIGEIVAYTFDAGNKPGIWRFTFAAGFLVVILQLIFTFVLKTFPMEQSDLKETTSQNNSHNHSIQKDYTIWDLVRFRIPEARKSFAIGILLHAGQQISGVNAVFFYSAMIVGNAPFIPVALTLINLAMTVVAIWLLERAGRRPVALFSVAGSAACLLALAASFAIFPVLAPIFLVTFVAAFAVGLGPIPWMLVPEIFPASWPLTPAAISICTASNWLTNIIITAIFPPLTKIVSNVSIFAVFGIFCTILLICIHQFLPETKNRIANFI